MTIASQIVPITDLRKHHNDILSKLSQGPVILAQRSRAAAVLVSVQEWDIIMDEVKRYRRLLLGDERSQELTDNPSMAIPWADAECELRNRGWLAG